VFVRGWVFIERTQGLQHRGQEIAVNEEDGIRLAPHFSMGHVHVQRGGSAGADKSAVEGLGHPIASDTPLTAKTGAWGVILLVEDERFVREPAAAILNEAGYEVLKARNAREARKIFHLREMEIKLLVADIVLPGASGFELSRELGAVNPAMKTIFLSGYANVAAGPPGAATVDCLTKPFSAEHLLGKIEAAFTDSAGEDRGVRARAATSSS